MLAVIVLLVGVALLLWGVLLVLSDAWRHGLVWFLGIIIIFPLVYPLFIILNRKRGTTRNGFLMSLSGLLIVMAAFYGGVGKYLPFKEAQEISKRIPTADPPDEPLPNEAEAQAIQVPEGYEPLTEDELDIPAEELALPPKQDKSVSPVIKTTPRRFYQAVAVNDASKYIGKQVRVHTEQGSTAVGKLVAGKGSKLTLEQSKTIKGGDAAFEHTYQGVTTLEVYDTKLPEPVVAPLETVPIDAGSDLQPPQYEPQTIVPPPVEAVPEVIPQSQPAVEPVVEDVSRELGEVLGTGVPQQEIPPPELQPEPVQE